MAPEGQNSWQQKQRTHLRRSMTAFLFLTVMAWAGHSRAQLPQPVQPSSSFGRERSSTARPFFTSFRRGLSSGEEANQLEVAPERRKSAIRKGPAPERQRGSPSEESRPRSFAAVR